ncbi:Pentatricopeptide repeat-containing protein 5, mitochondrial [Diplodia seriata]|uniref:Pentatricopeptide repeat-containing protein 5, mitochondrial n=1 Tax=Diplodia seriata TaxID=420778 RepID=A0A1S8BKM4_9PEZI|nr:Pentatricopeptide repeat-containing protein 5, mitochondrial [Diplodia seriata]
MVFKTLNLRSLSLAKTFTHGYAQSVVAASQSSYASQNFSHVSNRFAKHPSQQNGYASSAQPGPSVKPLHPDHHDSGLAAYFDAWHKHQRLENREWHQFQFAKRIEWKPPSNVQEVENAARDASAATLEDVDAEDKPTRGAVDRAYSASAVDDFKQVVDHKAEVEALAKIDEAINREIERRNNEPENDVEDAGSVAVGPDGLRPQSPAAVSQASPRISTPRSSTTAPTSVSDADTFATQLENLADGRHYAEIPAVFENMLIGGVKPTASAYNALLVAAIHLPRAKHQVVPKALDVYSDMLRRRVLPDPKTYSILIELLSVRSLEVLSSKQVLEEKRVRFGGMDEEGRFMLQSNETDFAILLEDDSLNMAVKLFNTASAIKLDSTFSEKTYRRLITACAELGRVEDMVRIYTHMESNSILPRAEMFVPMIHAFAASGDLRSSVECYNEYKALAIANDKGENAMTRKDNDVYAALIKAYTVCERLEGGRKFLSKLQQTIEDPERVASLRDIVGLKAFIPIWLKNGLFQDAVTHAREELSSDARNVAMAAICVRAADSNSVETAMSAFESLPEHMEVSVPAVAMVAMHIRNGNIEAAQYFWDILEVSDAKLSFVEPSAMLAIALIGSGHAERALRQNRRMLARLRDSQVGKTKIEAVEQIDEAVEVIGHFMIKRGIVPPAKASMELFWTMVENGGLLPSVAAHLLAGLGPDGVAQLAFEDLTLLMQIQAGMILNTSATDIANQARFSHVLEVLMAHATPIDKQTTSLIEKVLMKLDRPDLARRWQTFRYPVMQPMFSPVPFSAFGAPPPVAPTPMFEDNYDPYGATTDNKGSVVITDLLEKTHGRSASHLNEALTKFRNMRRAGRHPRYFTYAKLITAAAKEGRMDLAQDILSLAKQDVPFQPQHRIVRYGWVTILDSMVAACLQAGDRQGAARFHQELLDMGAAPSANTFGLYITTLKESTKTFDEATEAVKIFLRSKSEGVEPSSFLYNALIGKLGKARRIDDCLFYFQEMRNLGIRPTSVTYGTVVNALCRVSDEKFAEELFEEMESMPNYKPRPAPYHSMMQFFLTTKRDRSKVLSYYERMRLKGIEPTTHTYKLLIDTHATLEPVDMAAAESVLEQVRQSGQRPEAVHFASLIHAKGCVQHDMAAAKELFDSIIAKGEVRPQACLYQALFEAMVANHDIGATEAYLSDMRARHVELTPYIANSLVHGWAAAKNIEKAASIYESVPLGKREPSTYEAMTRAYMSVEDRTGAAMVVKEGLSRGYPAAVANKIRELIGGGWAGASEGTEALAA